MRAAGFTSVEELADHSGVSARTIFNCQYGVHTPTKSTLKLLAQSLRTKSEKVEAALSEPE